MSSTPRLGPPAAALYLLWLPCLLAMAPPLAAAPPPAADFVVVVNAATPLESLPAAEISRMFLQKSTRWRSGERVLAVDLPEDAPVRERFSQAVHGRATTAVKAYWQKMIFSGRDVPPPEKSSVGEVLAYVRANPGAIGYVPGGTPLPAGAKALKVTP